MSSVPPPARARPQPHLVRVTREIAELEVVVHRVSITLDHQSDGWRASRRQADRLVASHGPCVSARMALSVIGVDVEAAWAVDLAAEAEQGLLAGDPDVPLTAAAFVERLRESGVSV